MPKSRVEAFTDAVIAIIMTLLVLEIHQPAGAEFKDLLAVSHKFVIYVVSFVFLAIYWNSHHHLFHLVTKVNGRVLWANNFFIFSLSLFPFATAWVSDHFLNLVPQVTYGAVFFLANVAYYTLYKALSSAHQNEESFQNYKKDLQKMYLSIFGMLFGILLGFLINPLLIFVVNVLILLLWLIPDRDTENLF